MLQQDLIARPQALWIKIFHNRMVLMCHDGSTIATEYATSLQVSFASEQIIQNFKNAENSLQKLMHHVQLAWYHKPPIIFLQILEPITQDLSPLIQQAYLELGYNHARLVRLYNEAGLCLEPTPLKTVHTRTYLMILCSLILMGLIFSFYPYFFNS